jgi:hypothetical protein
MDYWKRAGRAALRGAGYAAIGGLITVGANSVLPHLLPEPWASFAFIGFIGVAGRAWPVLPAGEWWEEAWASGVIMAALALAGILTDQPGLGISAAVVGAAVLGYQLASKRRLLHDPLHQ